MILGLVCAKEKDSRDLVPILGRPMMLYPVLASLNTPEIDCTYVTTNSQIIKDVSEKCGAKIITRPKKLNSHNTDFGEIVKHAIEEAELKENQRCEKVVLLLGNAPTVSVELIQQSITVLEKPDIDSVVSVSKHNEHNPARACYINSKNELLPMVSQRMTPSQSFISRDSLGDVYFVTNCMRTIKRNAIYNGEFDLGLPYQWLGNKSFPLVQNGAYDVDYDWQVDSVVDWLLKEGFSFDSTPYKEIVHSSTVERKPKKKKNLIGNVLVTTVPFGQINSEPTDKLEESNIQYTINPIGRKLKENELADLIEPYEVLIAGTEPISEKVLSRAKNLKLIARVGIGLDSVDLNYARSKGIKVTYTPDGPSAAVAELTMAQILSALRYTHVVERGLRQGVWQRKMGRRLNNLTVGIIGVGRIGKRVIQHLKGWGASKILAHDINMDETFSTLNNFQWVDLETLLQKSDVISLHVPLTPDTNNLIDKKVLNVLKKDCVLINTSRGGIINESDLIKHLKKFPEFTSVIDTFESEPYSGELSSLDNCLLTCHMGSCTVDCRFNMELGATLEAIRYYKNEPFMVEVPEYEYELQSLRSR